MEGSQILAPASSSRRTSTTQGSDLQSHSSIGLTQLGSITTHPLCRRRSSPTSSPHLEALTASGFHWAKHQSRLQRVNGFLQSLVEGAFDAMERPGDTARDSVHRRVLVPVGIIFTIAAGITILTQVDQAGLCLAATAIAGISSALCWVVPVLRVRVSYSKLVGGVGLGLTAGVLLMDVCAAARLRPRTWQIVILVLDLMVLIESHRLLQQVVLALTLAVVAAERVEARWRYGLYEGGEWGTDAAVPSVCDCLRPPCEVPNADALHGWVIAVVVLAAEFYHTRAFAARLRAQLKAFDVSVKVAEHVAKLLAAYATDDARRVVTREGAALPRELREAYEQLLANLDSYRVFLPDSVLMSPQVYNDRRDSVASTSSELLAREWTQPASPMRPAPGAASENAEVAVCFTDIQRSTELWEFCPQGMYAGLHMHNAVIRDVYAVCQGYEVKTIGDSFMVAFDTGFDAVRFGLLAQEQLLAQQWADDLLRHPLCRYTEGPNGEPVWCGLRVRIGIQYGQVRVETNPVTGRCDYFGPTVNVAARLEALLPTGGLVATTDSVVRSIGPASRQQLGSPVVYDVGLRELRGVKESIRVAALVPQWLARRLLALSDASSPTSGNRVSPTPPPPPPPGREATMIALPHQNTDRGVLLQELDGLLEIRRCSPHAPPSVLGSPPQAPASPRVMLQSRAPSAFLQADSPRGETLTRLGRQAFESGYPVRTESFRSMGFTEGGSVTQETVRAPANVLPQRLNETLLSCAAVRMALTRMAPVGERVTPFVASIALAADQLRGVVECMLSSTVVVTFNAARPCPDHTDACRHFFSNTFRGPAHLGAASGSALSGHLSAGRRRFTCVLGGAVDFATALAEEAERCGDAALACGAVANCCASHRHAYWAQLWQVVGSPETHLVWEVDAQPDKWLLSDVEDVAASCARLEAFADDLAGISPNPLPGLFRRACSADPESEVLNAVLDELDQKHGCTAARLARRIRAGGVRIRPMPPLWDPRPLTPPRSATAPQR
eukprot:TRINITY_DN2212_c0_g4_i1.p1 TRINITY_DN2212_c0_g4~~TRINITY_DN2212_c0_g4_i1.p1  ORF type:complete len:1039 (+),score=224.98 TRINITY_DN2212_c0_g4_i1:83-3118(+)